MSLPRYYLRHQLPPSPGMRDGSDRFAYPAALIQGTPTHQYDRQRDPSGGWTWEGSTAGMPVEPVWSGSWLVTDQPLDSLTRRRKGQRVSDGWERRPEPSDPNDAPVPPEIAAEHPSMPDRPTEELLGHYQEHQASHACWECRRFLIHYRPRYVEGPEDVAVQDMSRWTELPADLPPVIDPDDWAFPPVGMRTGGVLGDQVEAVTPIWTPDSDSALAVFGRHTAHLWPGQLDGLRAAVAAALMAHPLVSRVHDRHSSHYTGERGFAVTVRVPWETPRKRSTWEKPTSRSRKRREVTRDVWALERSVTLQVSDGVQGDTMAHAIARWDFAVAEQVARFFPFGEQVAACDHCQGLGFVDPTRATEEATGRG